MLSLLFKKKSKGCLHGKTEQQKIDFFDSLISFATKGKEGKMFFEEQYWDLQEHERKEFSDYIIKRGENLRKLKGLVNVLSEILEKK